MMDLSRPPLDPVPPRTGAAAVSALQHWDAVLETTLSDDDRAALEAISRTGSAALGAVLLARGGRPAGPCALVAGEAMVGRLGPDGVLKTDRRLVAPAWMDLCTSWAGAPLFADAQACSADVQWRLLPQSALQSLLAQRPTLAAAFLARLASEAHRQACQTHALLHRDAPARLAQWLHDRCEEHARSAPADAAGKPVIVRLQQRKRDLATQLAITPETLSRLMRSFTHQGLIDVTGYLVHVRDPDALARLAHA